MDVTEAARARVVQIAASITAPVDDGTDIATLCEGVGLRVVFGRNEADFEFLSGSNQPFPFIAAATAELLRAGQRDFMELLYMIGRSSIPLGNQESTRGHWWIASHPALLDAVALSFC